MISLNDVILGIVVPLVVAGAVGIFLRKLCRDTRRPSGWVWSIAVAIGYLAGHLGLQGWPRSPMEAADWLAIAVLPAAAMVTAIAAPLWLRWAAMLIVAAGMPPLMLQSYLTYTWDTTQAVQWLSGLALGIWLMWVVYERLDHTAPGRSWPISICIAAGTSAAMVLMSGSQSLGQLGGVAAAVVAACAVILATPRGASIGWIAVAGTILLGRFYAELSDAHALMLAGLLLPAWVPELPFLRRMFKPSYLAIFRCVCVAVPAIAMLAHTGIRFSAEMSELGY